MRFANSFPSRDVPKLGLSATPETIYCCNHAVGPGNYRLWGVGIASRFPSIFRFLREGLSILCVISRCFASGPVGLEELNLSLGSWARPQYPCHCLHALRRPGEHNLRAIANIRFVDPRDGIFRAMRSRIPVLA
jgi:hypothetical protein